jgi:hypothetical protein
MVGSNTFKSALTVLEWAATITVAPCSNLGAKARSQKALVPAGMFVPTILPVAFLHSIHTTNELFLAFRESLHHRINYEMLLLFDNAIVFPALLPGPFEAELCFKNGAIHLINSSHKCVLLQLYSSPQVLHARSRNKYKQTVKAAIA